MVVHGPAVCEHCVLTAQLQAGRKPKKDPLGEPELDALFQAVKQWEAWLDACETSAPEGFIAAKRTGTILHLFALFQKHTNSFFGSLLPVRAHALTPNYRQVVIVSQGRNPVLSLHSIGSAECNFVLLQQRAQR